MIFLDNSSPSLSNSQSDHSSNSPIIYEFPSLREAKISTFFQLTKPKHYDLIRKISYHSSCAFRGVTEFIRTSFVLLGGSALPAAFAILGSYTFPPKESYPCHNYLLFQTMFVQFRSKVSYTSQLLSWVQLLPDSLCSQNHLFCFHTNHIVVCVSLPQLFTCSHSLLFFHDRLLYHVQELKDEYCSLLAILSVITWFSAACEQVIVSHQLVRTFYS